MFASDHLSGILEASSDEERFDTVVLAQASLSAGANLARRFVDQVGVAAQLYGSGSLDKAADLTEVFSFFCLSLWTDDLLTELDLDRHRERKAQQTHFRSPRDTTLIASLISESLECDVGAAGKLKADIDEFLLRCFNEEKAVEVGSIALLYGVAALREIWLPQDAVSNASANSLPSDLLARANAAGGQRLAAAVAGPTSLQDAIRIVSWIPTIQEVMATIVLEARSIARVSDRARVHFYPRLVESREVIVEINCQQCGPSTVRDDNDIMVGKVLEAFIRVCLSIHDHDENKV